MSPSLNANVYDSLVNQEATMEAFSQAVMIQAAIDIENMDLPQKAHLADQIFIEQPNLLASILVLHRMGAEITQVEVVLHILLVCHRAMKHSGFVWPLILEDVQETSLERLTAKLRATSELPTEALLKAGDKHTLGVLVLPDGSRGQRRHDATIDNSMIKAIARGFRWHRMLCDGRFATLDDIAASEKICPSYVSQVLRLAFLSPRVVQAILDGRQPAHLTMKDLMRPFPLEWGEQERVMLGRGAAEGVRTRTTEDG